MSKKIMKTMDGNTAAAYCSYAFSEVACIYPITPSSTMAELVDEWSANEKKNLFGEPVKVVEMQSEAGAAGALHGSLSAGALTTTYTASQGLLLMIPNMYKIAGELLPGVFHVSARAIASHALSIFGDQTDVMSVRQTGFALLATGSVQEVMDLAGVAHLASIKSSIPFLHFFDGFRTSHEIQKIEQIDYEVFERLLDKESLLRFRKKSLNPERPYTKGSAQNPDIFFQNRESINRFYDAIPDIVNEYMQEISKETGRQYKPFNYYGAADAEYIVVAMGSVTEALEETVDYLNERGQKTGLIKVHLYRPFSEKYFFDVMPKTVKAITVLDRTKEVGASAEPLHLDVLNMFYGKEHKPVILGGRYGLGSKDTTPSHLLSVFTNMQKGQPKNHFTISIVDDVTNLSLPLEETIDTSSKGTMRCKFWGLGSDGTVGANKAAIKIIGDNTDLYAQGYFDYDSKKSGGITVSHLRFGKQPIRSTYLIDQADFIACHNQSYVTRYDLLKGLRNGGTFVLNTQWSDEELDTKLPSEMKKYLVANNIQFYTVDAVKIGQELGLGNHINMIMQAIFFELTKVIPVEQANQYLKEAIQNAYAKKGDDIVRMNCMAIDKGQEALHQVIIPESWHHVLEDETDIEHKEEPDYIKNILRPVTALQGNDIPVSAFVGIEEGKIPAGTSQYEKRGIAVKVPCWNPENCVQCNQCSFVCPHAVIRPFLMTEEESKKYGAKGIPANGKELEGYRYRIQISPLDCTGCGNCADVCPGKKGKKALVMESIDDHIQEHDIFMNLHENVGYKENVMDRMSVKGSQFAQPLLEFSGACAGCGETPYAKVVTQLFGERMVIANATGCSSIWGASSPASVYTANMDGHGPAWANSLFEDNAEYGLGIRIAVKAIRKELQQKLSLLKELTSHEKLRDTIEDYLNVIGNAEQEKLFSKEMIKLLSEENYSAEEKVLVDVVLKQKEYLVDKSVWIFGGDGWAYDIGYGGLDHVIASGENVNILVFDTEVYSNTGGQSSKATPIGAVAKFAASGKRINKKDLGMIATAYGYVYVAQVGIGADKGQFVKALKEAEAYDGPALIIAYAPCINHGLKDGMGKTQQNIKEAVECGYWHLYRYNPLLKTQGKNPFVLDSKEPTASFREFLDKQVRYTSLKTEFPAIAEELYARAEEAAKEKYKKYKKLASMSIE
ncbi:pyruvate:ferredoxin (flavodoxin) oxidoreductase [Filifactor alocis]|uniref:pyruvate:ferredoxin (flavodoxin) oxidoreductase n=1 Tax=Filifactor alocis TaxID=143361 RepID=UPI0028D138C9|nr:pyruvate:ferredoxin (flavodoxin) oxidoreductase [Filifactor alocis]